MADTGYGNALNVERTVRLLERAGASAIQLEDQDFPKRCGHLDGKTLIAAPDMVGKIKAAADSRHADDTLIIALTDAADPRPRRRASRRRRSPSKASSAPSRAALYREAGADMLFIEAPRERTKAKPSACNSLAGQYRRPAAFHHVGHQRRRLAHQCADAAELGTIAAPET
jgi:2-methylisocitrate lyase-like PEP mutase family enzyme